MSGRIDKPSAVVSGFAAAKIAEHLARALDRGLWQDVPEDSRGELLRTLADLRWAAAMWRNSVDQQAVMSADGHRGHALDGVAAQWTQPMTTDEVAEMLDITTRQARRLGPVLGEKVSGSWTFDRALVIGECERRAREDAA